MTMTVLNKCWAWRPHSLRVSMGVMMIAMTDDRDTSGCGFFHLPRRKKNKSGFEDAVCTLERTITVIMAL